MAYPAKVDTDRSALPLVHTDGGAALLKVEFGSHVTLELIDIFVRAAKNGCQWIELRHTEPVLEEATWRNISSM